MEFTLVPQLHPSQKYLCSIIQAVALHPADLPSPYAPRCMVHHMYASQRIKSLFSLTYAIGHCQEVYHEGGFIHIGQDGVMQNDKNFFVKASG